MALVRLAEEKGPPSSDRSSITAREMREIAQLRPGPQYYGNRISIRWR